MVGLRISEITLDELGVISVNINHAKTQSEKQDAKKTLRLCSLASWREINWLLVMRTIKEKVCYSNTNNGVALPSSFIHAVVAAGQDPRHTDFF